MSNNLTKKILIVVDMQNDFVTGSLKNEMAQSIIPKIKDKITKYINDGNLVFFTRDTHTSNYLETFEGKTLPISHCIKDTSGWYIIPELKDLADNRGIYIDKKTFGHLRLGYCLEENYADIGFYNIDGKDVEITLIGVCTGICVISNAIIIKTGYPEANVQVDASCCACITEESHKTALEAMKLVHIDIINEGCE